MLLWLVVACAATAHALRVGVGIADVTGPPAEIAFRNTVRLWIRRYEAEGSLEHRPRVGRTRVLTEDNVQRMVDIYQEENAFTPTRVCAEEYDVSTDTIRRALH
ncbi:hypothetical protein B5X24_HaOG212763, partial [Helicoverpa armigera]